MDWPKITQEWCRKRQTHPQAFQSNGRKKSLNGTIYVKLEMYGDA